jgi:hypothetical protein
MRVLSTFPDLERDHLGDAQPGAIGRGQRRWYFDPGAAL